MRIRISQSLQHMGDAFRARSRPQGILKRRSESLDRWHDLLCDSVTGQSSQLIACDDPADSAVWLLQRRHPPDTNNVQCNLRRLATSKLFCGSEKPTEILWVEAASDQWSCPMGLLPRRGETTSISGQTVFHPSFNGTSGMNSIVSRDNSLTG